METQIKQSYIKEIQYQTQMMNHLQRWLRNSIIFSSISLVLVLFGPSLHFALRIIGIISMIISIHACFVIGHGLKNGKDNIQKIIDYIK